MKVAILILAAGASSRMGGTDKLLEDVGGETLLRRVVRQAAATGSRVGVALPAGDAGLRRRVELKPFSEIQMIEVLNPGLGISASIRAGVDTMSDAPAIAILPADLPEITTSDIGAVLSEAMAKPEQPARAIDANGKPGHPVVFPARFFPAMLQLDGDQGAARLLANEQVTLVPTTGVGATLDLDTPKEWAAWRRAPN